MPKSTLYFIFALTIIATLLLGINIGKKLNFSQSLSLPTLRPNPSPTITQFASPFPTQTCSALDGPCGYGFAGNSLGTCCTGLICVESGVPDMGGTCQLNKNPSQKSPSPSPIKRSSDTNQSLSTFTDASCGFSFSYPGGYLSSNTVNGKSVILTDPDDESKQIIGACEDEIPKPPLPPEKVESIIVDGVTTNLYHDADSQTGKPRNEIIVKHPSNGKEIILAGFGADFDSALASFKFMR